MTTQPFNATEILNQLRHRQAVKRKRQFHHSRLMRVRAELVALRQAGGSYRSWRTGCAKPIVSAWRIR